MELFLKKEMCCGCSACVDICPEGAISMIQDREGFYYPKIENSLCNNCRKCEQVCVIKRKIEMQKEQVPLYLGVQAKNQRNRFSSSSGGIFSILAQYVIGKKVIVYGAGYATKEMLSLLQQHKIEIAGFAVTKRNQDQFNIFGHHIYEITELQSYCNEAIVLIAANRKFNREIQDVLEKNGFTDYIFLNVEI